MATLQGTVYLDRSTVTEVVSDPNKARAHLVSGTAGGLGGGFGKLDEIEQAGQFRQYGNGNVRLILGSAQSRTQTLALKALTPSQVETVRGLIGRTLCYRDTYGRKIYGAFLSAQILTLPHSGRFEDGTLLTDIGITIQSVTFTEAV